MIKRIVEFVWLTLIVVCAGWVVYQSFTVIPNPPCEWRSDVSNVVRPPGLGLPQLAFLAVLALIYRLISWGLNNTENKLGHVFAFMTATLTLALPLIVVVDIEIYGGCLQMGGPEFSRNNSMQTLILLLVFSPIEYAMSAALASAIIVLTVFVGRLSSRKSATESAGGER